MAEPDPNAEDEAPRFKRGAVIMDPLDHDLPALRVCRAREEAEAIAKRRKIDRKVAMEIAEAVIGIIGEGTWRSGHRCPTCKAPIQWKGTVSRATCPNCGYLGQMAPLALDIAFPPVEYGGSTPSHNVTESRFSRRTAIGREQSDG